MFAHSAAKLHPSAAGRRSVGGCIVIHLPEFFLEAI